jgi:hypothetical protein
MELCCLCLEEQDNKIQIRLVCQHTMDYNCFLSLRSAQCPLCRHPIETPTQFITPQCFQWNGEIETTILPLDSPLLLRAQHILNGYLNDTSSIRVHTSSPSHQQRQRRAQRRERQRRRREQEE